MQRDDAGRELELPLDSSSALDSTAPTNSSSLATDEAHTVALPATESAFPAAPTDAADVTQAAPPTSDATDALAPARHAPPMAPLIGAAPQPGADLAPLAELPTVVVPVLPPGSPSYAPLDALDALDAQETQIVATPGSVASDDAPLLPPLPGPPQPQPQPAADVAQAAAMHTRHAITATANRSAAHGAADGAAPYGLDEPIPPLRLTPLQHTRRASHSRWGWLGVAALLLVLPILLIHTLWPAISMLTPFGGPADRLPAGATAWADATAITALPLNDRAFGAQTYPVDAQFAVEYAARGGAVTLGAALTPAFTSNLGPTQFFANGAFVRVETAASDQATASTGDQAQNLDPALALAGVRDAATGVTWLPLSHTLLSDGSVAPVGGADSPITYATLRAATLAPRLVQAPAAARHIKLSAALPQLMSMGQGDFVLEGIRAGKLVGHAIPAAIWSYINQAQVAPHGWLHDLGEPLTEALPATITSNGQQHHLLVQAFWQTIVVADLDQPQATALQPVGLDYLHTVGAPSAFPTSGAHLWTTQDGALRSAPGATSLAVSLGANAGVTLTGAAQWAQGALWYAAQWSIASRSGSAWVAASALSASQPTGPLMAGFDTLSPSLASYLSGMGNNVGAEVYDISRNTIYTYNPNGLFTMASSAKVPLMVSYLANIESQGRGPNSFELATLTAMIEHSDNNAAQVIYDTLGDDEQNYMQSWDIHDYILNPNGWGWGEWSPADMVHLLTLLHDGKVLNSADRALAFNLMENIESDQRFGAGDTAPARATVAMKDGWVNEPDGPWAVNSSGVITLGDETYIVSVYTEEQADFGTGESVVNHVCGVIAQALN